MSYAPLFVIAASLAGAAAGPESMSYTLPITRNGKTVTRVAYKDWNGEYPGPVIVVGPAKPGTTTIQAQKSVRKLEATQPCTIANGIYHPWSTQKGSTLTFYTLLPLSEYDVLADAELDQSRVRKGDVISQVVGLGENACSGVLMQGGQQKGTIEFTCTEVDDPKRFAQKATSDKDSFREQWIYVQCKEGHKAFVRDEELLKQAGVSEGKILEYGKVGR